MCFQSRATSPSLPATPASASRPTRSISPPVYTVQFIVGSLESPENVPRPSVYMPSTLASKSPYLRRRIQPPGKDNDVTQVVLVDAYHDALNLYKVWLERGVVPKFRRSTSTPVPTPERKLLWSECFDLVRAHVLGSRFQHLEFSDFIMSELIRWLDPLQDADMDILDFVFTERGVNEALQCFVVDRMFMDEAHVRTIFRLFLERKRKGRVGNFRMARSHEYCSRYDDRHQGLLEVRDGDQTVDGETPPPPPPKPYPRPPYELQEPHRPYSQRMYTSSREPSPLMPMSSDLPFQLPVPFPPAIYVASAANDAIVRKYDVRRKPLPRDFSSSDEDNHVLVRPSSWPILRPGVVVSMDGEEQVNGRSSVQGTPRAMELDGRSLTPDEISKAPMRPDSAP